MLKLRKGKPPVQRVLLGAAQRDDDGNEIAVTAPWIDVRPATQFDVELTLAKVRLALAAIVDGSEAAKELAGILGDEFDTSGLADEARLAAASRRLSDAYLVMACCHNWSGIADEDGHSLGDPEPAGIAFLLDDPVIHHKVMAVINGAVHEEVFEGNASPASPIGEAGHQGIAPVAGPRTSPARGASALTANVVPNSTSRH